MFIFLRLLQVTSILGRQTYFKNEIEEELYLDRAYLQGSCHSCKISQRNSVPFKPSDGRTWSSGSWPDITILTRESTHVHPVVNDHYILSSGVRAVGTLVLQTAGRFEKLGIPFRR